MKTLSKILMLLAVFFSGMAYSQTPQSNKRTRILIVVTSNSEVKGTGDKTGIWIEEFASPYYLFKQKGVEITVASPEGGASPIDPRSILPDYSTDAVKEFLRDQDAQDVLNNTVALSKVNAKNFDAIYYPGGHGPMWDLPDNKYSIHLIESFYNAGKPVALVCHGPVALKNVKAKDGSFLVKGKKIAGYATTEEQAGQTTKFVPFLLEDILKADGANYVKGPDWQPFVVTDGLLITGQNPASASPVAEKLLAAIAAQKK